MGAWQLGGGRSGVNDVFGSVLVTVNDEDAGGKTYDFLGCVAINLLDIVKGDVWYALKEKDLLTRATGDILISCEFHYDELKARPRSLLLAFLSVSAFIC